MDGSSEPLDLIARAPDPWEGLEVPRGWEPVARICRRVHDTVDALIGRMVGSIKKEIPEYAEVSDADLSASILRNLEMLLPGIAGRRGPSREELEVRRELGHRRAIQGLPIEAVLRSYRVGYRDLWQALVAAANNEEPEAAALLLEAANTVWGWVHEISDAVAAGHRETTHALEAAAVAVRHRFVELVISVPGSAEPLQLARSLGFQPESPFQALAARAPEMDQRVPGQVQRRVAHVGGRVELVPRGSDLLALLQDAPASAVESAIFEALPEACIGVGMARPGLSGARVSIADAELALGVAVRRGGVCRFEEEGLTAVALASQQQLEAFVERGIDAARSSPHVADAVKAFAASGFSLTDAARELRLHPNSVAYRLDRWEGLTGWDVKTAAGLMRSVLSLELA
ncbi:MAG TPA: helix-turn-helix domain-containing protein [Actinomycetota bacterium]|nr:helix-turn-helix domain-containing protein [Actinomycetota bacterium]